MNRHRSRGVVLALRGFQRPIEPLGPDVQRSQGSAILDVPPPPTGQLAATCARVRRETEEGAPLRVEGLVVEQREYLHAREGVLA